jgi:hypothetical protein
MVASMMAAGASSRAIVTATIVMLLVLLTALPVLMQPGSFIQDDSYFYLQIARHIAAGHGSTFHEITPTNGYHPLWMLCVVAVMALVDGDKILALNLVVALQIVLTAATLYLLKRLMTAIGLQVWLPGVALVAAYLFGTGLYGSEAHLNALTLVIAVLAVWKSMSTQRASDWFMTGVATGVAILARLDNVFVAGMLLAFGLLLHSPQSIAQLLRRGTITGLGVLLIVAPYLIYNVLTYGHLVPISGAIKSHAAALSFDIERLGAMGRLAVPFGLVCLAIGTFVDTDRRRQVIWLGLGSGVALHALYVVAWTDHYTFWAWYYVSGVLAAGLAVSYVTERFITRIRPWLGEGGAQWLVIGVTCALLAGSAVRAWLKAFGSIHIGPVAIDASINEYRWPEELAVWMRAHIPPGTVVFVQDWPGAIAYYSDLTILPMDGLVNDFRYNDELLARGAEQYLCSQGVDLFFGHLFEPAAPQRVPVYAPLYRRVAGTLTLQRDDLLIETRSVLREPDEAPPYALWHMACPDRRP